MGTLRSRRAGSWLLGMGVAVVAGMLGCAEVSAPAGQECNSSEDCVGGLCEAGACVATADATGDPADDPGDTQREVTPLTDTGDVPSCTPFPEACTRNLDCCSGYCIDTDEGRVCTQLCAEDSHCTGEDWECRVLAGSEPDVVRFCVPPRQTLCQPCTNDTQCGGLNDFCLQQDDGRFCATNCSATRLCDDGYVCNLLTIEGAGANGEALDTYLCEPDLGVCGDEPIVCETGFADCDDGDALDCETDLNAVATCGTSCATLESCVDGDPCTQDQCFEGECLNAANCGGTSTSCGCASCADCTLQNGWYDLGETYACCDVGSACTTCQDQEYRTYTCDGTSCAYAVTDTQTTTSECTPCGDGDLCTNDLCADGACVNPASCEGSSTSCGCASCADCTASDGWFEVGPTYACCEGSFRCVCQDRELRAHACGGTECTYAVTDTETLRSGCEACSDGDACTQDLCSGGVCAHPGNCTGASTSCGCTSCTDCTASDGWYNLGAAYACCDGTQSCSSCQDRELRAYACSGAGCTYTVTATDTTRNACSACNDGNTCTQDLCVAAGVCSYPANCEANATSCGCTSCSNCTLNDGWYDLGAPYACCNGAQSCSTCQDQQLRSYTCSGTGCTFTVIANNTVTSGCSACGDGNSCTQDLCGGAGVCSNPAICSGSNTSCGCTSCSNCTANNGWYNVGSAYACCNGTSSCSSCQDQQFRTYTCSGTSCTFSVTNSQTLRNGCSSCNDGNSCTQNVCSGAGSCTYPNICSGSSTSCGCSTCTNCSALPNVSSTSCSSQSCVINTCGSGFANCDTSTANGCERQLSGYTNSAPGEGLGSYAGDRRADFFCPEQTCQLRQTRSGTRGRWFNVTANEDSDCCAYVAMTYELAVPADANFDLAVTGACTCAWWNGSTWVAGCTAQRGSGGKEFLVAWCDDDCGGGNNGFTTNVEVRYVSGSSCGSWVLDVFSRDCYP